VGVRFTELAGGRCLIGDDMGIGKTIQALAYASLHEELWPVLVVCPASVKYNWAKEIEAWLREPSYQVVNGYKGDLEDKAFTIVNYDLMDKRKEQLLDMDFNLVIFDESHFLKNNTAKRTKASLEIGKKSKSVLCLSGTAITSRPEEYFTTLNLLRPIEFPSWLRYVQRYCNAYHNGYGWDTRGSSNTDELHAISRDFVIRRLKKEVMEELPDKIRQNFMVKPSVSDMKGYKDLQSSWLDDYRLHKENHTLPKGFVLNMLTDLRHNCGVIKARPAIEWVHEYVYSTGRPVVVYTHHKDVMQTVCDSVNDDLVLETISGADHSKKRAETIERFQNGSVDVLVCNILAANMGITLTKADTVLFVEREWVPATEEQAEDRVNRIGQDSQSVHAVYLCVANTIDERFAHIVSQKREVVKGILDGGEGEERHRIATELLMHMVQSGDMPADMLEDFGL
jgi:SWI/SNF-related matrix-associated actin-dependent regulator 1 of chromatin subfamily A